MGEERAQLTWVFVGHTEKAKHAVWTSALTWGVELVLDFMKAALCFVEKEAQTKW